MMHTYATNVPAPFIMDENATCICTAKKAPEDRPETDVSEIGMLRAGREIWLWVDRDGEDADEAAGKPPNTIMIATINRNDDDEKDANDDAMMRKASRRIGSLVQSSPFATRLFD